MMQYTLQHCDHVIENEYTALPCKGKRKSGRDSVKMTADEVALNVQNSKGWTVTFDKTPATVCI